MPEMPDGKMVVNVKVPSTVVVDSEAVIVFVE